MKLFSKLAAASALALSMAAVAAPANAVVIVDFADSLAGATMSWKRDGDQVGGDLAAGGNVTLNIYDEALTAGPISLASTFTLNARDDTAATVNNTDLNQWELAGNFSFVALNAFVYNSVNYAAGTNLLSASFTGADFGGGTGGRSGFFKGVDGIGGTVNYTSAILPSAVALKLDQFAFNFSAGNVPFSATGCGNANCTTSLASISGNTKGTFSAAIPEPGTWALMILGFGGAGAMLRSRRKVFGAA